jgi:putative ABC transport system permease protein
MRTLTEDVRYGARALRSKPGFVVVTILTLALGIGGTTAMFSVVNAVLLRPLPFPEADRLVMVWEDASGIGFPQNTPAPGNFQSWRSQVTLFEGMAAVDERAFNLTGHGEPEKVEGRGVTAGFFDVLGVAPALGRAFRSDEDAPGAGAVAILSDGLWRRRFGADPAVLGRALLLNGERFEIVGVMPRGFQFLEGYVGLWVPAARTAEEEASRNSHYLTVVGRLKAGVRPAEAQAEIERITSGIAADFPDQAAGLKAFVLPLRDQLTAAARRPLLVLSLATAAVLLIACANVAGLLLARAAARRREIAVRAALGAGRGRIVRQLLTENLLLAALAVPPGLVVALWSLTLLEPLVPSGLTLASRPEIDGAALACALAASLVTGLLFGLAPALHAATADLNEALKQGARGVSGPGPRGWRSALVVAEVAATLVLLVGAGLLMQTLYRLRYADVGFRSERVLTFRTALPSPKYDVAEKRWAFYEDVLDRVAHLPGVVSAGYTTSVPLEWKGGTNGFVLEGVPREPGVSYDANHRQISRSYLQTMGVPLRRGRYFGSADRARTQPVAIVNETMARQYWGQEDVVGKRLRVGGSDESPWITIVGVVGDVRQMGLDVAVKAEMYFPLEQAPDQPWFTPRDLVVRTAIEGTGLVPAVKREIQAVDPEQPVSNIRRMDEILDEEVAPRRLGAALIGIFAALAVTLAALGIYGLLSYFVEQHSGEIGVRLALGATGGDILRLVLRQGMTLALIGVGLGAALALAAGRLLSSLLYGVAAADAGTLGAAAALLTAMTVVACYLPARRATRVDPLVALRSE